MRRTLLALALLLGACSDDVDVATSPRTDAWITQVLGSSGADTQPMLVAHEDDLVALTTDDDGVLRAWVSDERGSFEAASTPAADGYYLTAAAAGDTGLVAAGRTDDFVHAALWYSADGTEWELVDDDAFDAPADVVSIAAADDGFVAVGALRTGDDPSYEPFEAAAWWSDDGRDWALVELGFEGSLSSVTVVGDVVLGAAGDGVWRSDDGGRSWSEDAVALPDGVDALATLGTADDGRTIVLVDLDARGMGGGGGLWRSDDLGETWRTPSMPEDTRFDVGSSLWLGDRSVLGLVGYDVVSIDPASCYVHLDDCEGGQPDAHVAVAVDDDASTWQRVDLTGIDPPVFSAYDVGALADGRLVVLGAAESTLTVWTWDGDSPPVATTTTVAPEPAGAPPMAQHGDDLELDVIHRFPLGLHCGIGQLGSFNGMPWAVVGPEPGIAEDWPVAGGVLYGYVTLVAADRIEYAIDAGGDDVIATYAPYDGPPVTCE